MSQLSYGDIKTELQSYAKFDPTDSAGGWLYWINKAVREVAQEFGGMWKALLVEDYSLTLGIDNLTLTPPSNWRLTRMLSKTVNYGSPLYYKSDYNYYYAPPVSDATVVSAVRIPSIKLINAGSSGGAYYLNYWRYVHEFANEVATQYPDLPYSGDAIIARGKYDWASHKDEPDNVLLRLGNEYKKKLKELRNPEMDNDSDPDVVDETGADSQSYASYNEDDGGV